MRVAARLPTRAARFWLTGPAPNAGPMTGATWSVASLVDPNEGDGRDSAPALHPHEGVVEAHVGHDAGCRRSATVASARRLQFAVWPHQDARGRWRGGRTAPAPSTFRPRAAGGRTAIRSEPNADEIGRPHLGDPS